MSNNEEQEPVPECVLIADKIGEALATRQIPDFGYWCEELTTIMDESEHYLASTFAGQVTASFSEGHAIYAGAAGYVGGFRLHRDGGADSARSFLVLVVPEEDPEFIATARQHGLEDWICIQPGCQAVFDSSLARNTGATGWRWIPGFLNGAWVPAHEHKLARP